MTGKAERKSLAKSLKFLADIDRFEEREFSTEELAYAYRQTFDGKHGQIVLYDLIKASRIFAATDPSLNNFDQRVHIENGQRAVGYHILSALGYEPKTDQPTQTVNQNPETKRTK